MGLLQDDRVFFSVPFETELDGSSAFANVASESGVVRSTTDGKINYLLVYDGPMIKRWAKLLTDAIASKGKRNWMNGRTKDDLERFREGFARHANQWLDGEDDEDHAAAIVFNLNGAEYVEERLRGER